MANRAAATIILGGTLSEAAYRTLVDVIVGEGLSTHWCGPLFDAHHRTVGQPLFLCDHDVPGAQFEELERWCITHNIPFVRWSSACAGGWEAGRVVFDPAVGQPRSYAADKDNRVLIDLQTVTRLGSYTAILDHFRRANFIVPPLIVEGDPVPATTSHALSPQEETVR
ncbi:hypothetical protein [Sphingomonas crocodyli]|uniref:Uncharacterized protein n=1 Tax=Sphingomonas crocodyli TaxID=1979270 RepID=A0A437M5I8_9SPHN|nr:hypothetical protein [Sphingomonas crocodyli]RVT92990.1 hypothetical protein EOD43_03550 [Sphingomonas crocodyli]